MKYFNVGDEVVVFNKTISGRYCIEGKAIIVGPSDFGGDLEFRVRFVEDGEDGNVYNRFVDPDAQEDPEGYVKGLNEEIGV